MEFKQNSLVKSATGEAVGRVSHFVIDPRSEEITHLVVEKGFLFTEDRVVPVEAVSTTSGEEIILAPDKGEPNDFPYFDQSYFVRPGEYSTDPEQFPSLSDYYYYPPIVGPGGGAAAAAVPQVREAVEELPDNTVALHKGADVYDRNSELTGQVYEVITSPDTRRLSHIVISQGLFNKTYRLVPVHWIKSMSSERVDLGTAKSLIDNLPDYAP